MPLVLAAQGTPTPTPTPKPAGAALWYVPGITQQMDQYGNPTFFAEIKVLNPNGQTGLVTASFKDPYGVEWNTASATIPAMGTVHFESFNSLGPNTSYSGYAVITSEVPVFVNANQTNNPVGATDTYHLDAYSGRSR